MDLAMESLPLLLNGLDQPLIFPAAPDADAVEARTQPLEVGAAPDQDAPVQQALPPALLPLEQQEIGVAWVDVEPQPAQFLREIAALLLQLLVDAKWPVRRIL